MTVADLEEGYLLSQEREEEKRWQLAIKKASSVHREMEGRRANNLPPCNPAALQKARKAFYGERRCRMSGKQQQEKLKKITNF